MAIAQVNGGPPVSFQLAVWIGGLERLEPLNLGNPL